MKAALGFIALAVIAGALIGATRLLTTPHITANQVAREQTIVNEILGTDSNQVTDVAAIKRLCRTSVRGYAGNIDLLVLPDQAITTNAESISVTAVRVFQHRETPGIGDFITTDSSEWIFGFAGLKWQQTPRDTNSAWNERIDAVSGATITRRAMIKGVANACEPTS